HFDLFSCGRILCASRNRNRGILPDASSLSIVCSLLGRNAPTRRSPLDRLELWTGPPSANDRLGVMSSLERPARYRLIASTGTMPRLSAARYAMPYFLTASGRTTNSPARSHA